MVTHLIDLLVQFVVATISLSGYAGVFFLMLLESCGVPIPSEVIMPFSGFLVVSHAMRFWPLAIIGALGNLTGSLIAYWIGLRGGRPLIEKYGKYLLISRHDLNLADKWFTARGDWTVFFGRLLPVVRTYISFPAGIAKMDIKRFAAFTFAGALPWSALFVYLGVKAGSHWQEIREWLHNFDIAIAVVIVLVVGLYVMRHVKHSR